MADEKSVDETKAEKVRRIQAERNAAEDAEAVKNQAPAPAPEAPAPAPEAPAVEPTPPAPAVVEGVAKINARELKRICSEGKRLVRAFDGRGGTLSRIENLFDTLQKLGGV